MFERPVDGTVEAKPWEGQGVPIFVGAWQSPGAPKFGAVESELDDCIFF